MKRVIPFSRRRKPQPNGQLAPFTSMMMINAVITRLASKPADALKRIPKRPKK